MQDLIRFSVPSIGYRYYKGRKANRSLQARNQIEYTPTNFIRFVSFMSSLD